MLIKSTRDLAKVDLALKVLVYAISGAGKTTMCPDNSLIISAEAGLLSLANRAVDYVEVTTMEELQEVYAFVSESEEAAKYDWICLDSISEIGEVVLAEQKRQTKDPRKAYGELQDQMAALIRAFRDLRGRNVYFSCKQDRLKDEATGSLIYGPSMPGQKLAQSLPYFFDEVFALRCERDDEGNLVRVLQTFSDQQYTCKDRSGVLAPYEEPDLNAILEKIRGAQQ